MPSTLTNGAGRKPARTADRDMRSDHIARVLDVVIDPVDRDSDGGR